MEGRASLMTPSGHSILKQCKDSWPIYPKQGIRVTVLDGSIQLLLRAKYVMPANLQIYSDNVVNDQNSQSYLHMVAWKSRCSKSFLCLIHQLSFGYTQYKSSLISSGCCGSYSISVLPSSVDTFTRIKKIQFYYLHFITDEQSTINLISIHFRTEVKAFPSIL
jgi:hypothetical protein